LAVLPPLAAPARSGRPGARGGLPVDVHALARVRRVPGPPRAQHRLTRNMFDAWLRRPDGSPADVVSRRAAASTARVRPSSVTTANIAAHRSAPIADVPSGAQQTTAFRTRHISVRGFTGTNTNRQRGAPVAGHTDGASLWPPPRVPGGTGARRRGRWPVTSWRASGAFPGHPLAGGAGIHVGGIPWLARRPKAFVLYREI
jgi:hypothetical protein